PPGRGAPAVGERSLFGGFGELGLALLEVDGALEQLRDVEGGDLFFLLLGLHAVGDHRLAERAGARDRVGAGLEELERALYVHPLLARLLLLPHLRAARAAAQAALAVPVLG